MRSSPARRTILTSMAFGLTGLGLGSAHATPADDKLTEPGSGQLRALMDKLSAAPRRRDFKTVPMILTLPDQWDAEALDLVLASKAEPRQVWNNYDIAGYWLAVMSNALNTQIWGFQHPDFLVVSATHGSAGLALYDQPTWDKYEIGKVLGGMFGPKGDKFKTNAMLAEPTGDPKDFENPEGLFAMGAANSIPLLQKRGIVFMGCHNAVWGHAGLMLKQGHNPDKLSHDALAAELTNHLIPGTILTPGIVGTLPELQKAGFFYANI